MTESDPNTTVTPEGEQIILEPGDPGYVAPNPPTPADAPGMTPTPDEMGVIPAPLPSDAPAGENLEWVREPGETDSAFAARTRGQVVESQSPSDIVPNMPQIRPFPVVEPTPPPEAEEVPAEEVVEPAPEGEAVVTETPVVTTP